MSEGHVIKACIEWLHWHGFDIIRNNSGGLKDHTGRTVRFGKKGSGDILALSPFGRWCEIECKFGKGEVSEHQIARQKLVTSKGGVYIICRNSADELEVHKDRILAKPNWSHP